MLKGFIPLNKDKISRFKTTKAKKVMKIITILLKIAPTKYEENKFNNIAKNNIPKILQKFHHLGKLCNIKFSSDKFVFVL